MQYKQLKRLFFTFFCCLFSISLLAQEQAIIKGTIFTSDGKPAEGVSVQLQPSRLGGSTNERGEYQIPRVPYGTYKVSVSAVGLTSREVSVFVNKSEVYIPAISLQEDASQLKEVIIKGIGTNPYTRRVSDHVAKMPLSNLENSQVYTTITKETLKDQVVTNFNDALKNSSGLDKLWSSTGRAGDGAAYYSLRGFTTQPSLINGIAGVTNGDLDPANIEQIEVVKGPSGALYGGAIVNFGGLINVVTKRPVDTLGGEVSYTIGNFAQHRATLDLYGPVTKDRKLLARVNAAYHTQNSFQDRGFRRSLFVAPSLEYRANDRLTINLDIEHMNTEATNPLMIFLNRRRPLIATTPDELAFDYNRSYTSEDLTFRNPTTNLRGQALYKISDQWSSRTSISYSNRQTDGYGQYVMYLDADNEQTGMVANDTVLSRYVTRQDAKSELLNVQQNFNGDFSIGGLRNRVLLGLDYLRIANTNNNAPYILFDRVNSSFDDPQYNRINRQLVDDALAAANQDFRTVNYASNNVYSAYAADVINFTPALSLMLSLRVDHFESKGTINRLTDVTTGDYSQTALAPKVGVVYQLVPNQVSFFANYQNGFRNVAPVNQPLPDISGTFRPQQANQFEGGVKVDAFKNRLSLTASYYDIYVSNITRPETVIRNDTAYNITVQDGNQTSRGFEIDLTARPVDQLNIILGYSNNYSGMVRSALAVEGRRPVSAGPRQLFNYWVSYRFDDLLKGFGLGIGGNAASENIITNDARTGTFTLPGYMTHNASIFYDHRKFRITLKADNFTDEVYFKGWTTIEPQMPRSFLANLTYKF